MMSRLFGSRAKPATSRPERERGLEFLEQVYRGNDTVLKSVVSKVSSATAAEISVTESAIKNMADFIFKNKPVYNLAQKYVADGKIAGIGIDADDANAIKTIAARHFLRENSIDTNNPTEKTKIIDAMTKSFNLGSRDFYYATPECDFVGRIHECLINLLFR